jgi:hypothetical protein
MSSILNYTVTEVKKILPVAISEGGDFYQEHLRGTRFSSMVPAIIGRGAYRLTESICEHTFGREHGILMGFGLAWAVCSYKGLEERTWIRDWASIACLSTVNAMINYSASKALSFLSSNDQEEAGFVLRKVARMVQTCVLYKLQCERNPSLPLRPYLYYGATVTLIEAVTDRCLIERTNKGVKIWFGRNKMSLGTKNFSGFFFAYGVLTVQLVAKMQVGMWIAKAMTGKDVQVSRIWEILTFVGVALANRYK